VILTVLIDGNPSASDDEAAHLLSDILVICPAEIRARSVTERQDLPAKTNLTTKGDPITLGAIILAAVASGGVLTKALSPGGFLTKLADILYERIKKDVKISITASSGDKVELTGTSKEIESLLRKHFRKDRRG
jgi:hypothetical protein